MSARESILGARIAWSVLYDGREGDEHRVRTGVVWSAGPVTGTAWVIPDVPEPAEGYAVCVKVENDGYAAQRAVDYNRSTAAGHEWQLRLIRQRGHVAARGAADVRVRVDAVLASDRLIDVDQLALVA
jgi:hypothetical protein